MPFNIHFFPLQECWTVGGQDLQPLNIHFCSVQPKEAQATLLPF